MPASSRTLQAQGSGHIELPPDLLVLSLTLTNQHKEYDKSLFVGRQLREILQETLAPAGISPDDLKIHHFSVLPRRVKVSRYEDKERYEDRYECEQDLELRLPLDMVQLQRILSLCSLSLANPSIRIRFDLKEPASAEDAAFAAAVHDAKRKAHAVADAAGVTLGDIIDIRIGDEDGYFPPPMAICGDAASGSSAPPSPEELTVDATVNIIWAIS